MEDKTTLKWLVKTAWLFLMTALLAGFGYHFYLKFQELQLLRRRQMDYQVRIDDLEARIAVLAREIEELHHNPDRLEMLAREKLGLAGENEKIFIIETEPTPAGE